MNTTTVYAIFLASYFACMLAIGVYHALRIRSVDEYLIAGWSVGFWKIVGTSVATSCGAATFIGFVGWGYAEGISALFVWVLPGTIFGFTLPLIFARTIRRLKLYTIPDVFVLRFGRRAALIPAVFQIVVYSVPTLAIQFIGLAVIFQTFFGTPTWLGILLGFALIFVYTIMGGMPSTIATDGIQAIILLAGLVLMTVFGLSYAGGLDRVLAITPAYYWSPMGRSEVWNMLAIALTVGPFYVVFQANWQRIFAARTEETAVHANVCAGIISIFVPCLSIFIGIAARGYLPLDLRPDLVFTQAVQTVFPAVLGGAVIVGLAAAVMSSGDSYIMMGSASIARDVYQQYIRPQATSRDMLAISRWSVLWICTASLAVALLAKGIINIYLVTVQIVGAGLFFPFLALMFWRRATRKGILWSMAAGGLITVGLSVAGYDYHTAIYGYAGSLLVLVSVSLMTRHADDEQVRAAFFEPLETADYHALMQIGDE